jgi:hypothetical protein
LLPEKIDLELPYEVRPNNTLLYIGSAQIWPGCYVSHTFGTKSLHFYWSRNKSHCHKTKAVGIAR